MPMTRLLVALALVGSVANASELTTLKALNAQLVATGKTARVGFLSTGNAESVSRRPAMPLFCHCRRRSPASPPGALNAQPAHGGDRGAHR